MASLSREVNLEPIVHRNEVPNLRWGMPAAFPQCAGSLPQWMRNIQKSMDEISDTLLQKIGAVTKIVLIVENTTHKSRYQNGGYVMEGVQVQSTKTETEFSSPTICNFLDEVNFARTFERMSMLNENQRCKMSFALEVSSSNITECALFEVSLCRIPHEEEKGNEATDSSLQSSVSSSSNTLSSSDSAAAPAPEETALSPTHAESEQPPSPTHSEVANNTTPTHAEHETLLSPAHSEVENDPPLSPSHSESEDNLQISPSHSESDLVEEEVVPFADITSFIARRINQTRNMR